MPRILFIFGTRPEAIKLSPVALYFRRHEPQWEVRICVTAQHRELLDQVLECFQLQPDADLDLMRPGHSLAASSAAILARLEPVLAAFRPDLVFVQGDTTTTLCGALSAFYARIPVAHVEAGLRTGNPEHPFPEEMNRVLVSRLARLHFAATSGAAANLQREGIAPERVFVTGNTGIDAVLHVRQRLETERYTNPLLPEFETGRRLIVVTAHRRESFGPGIVRICQALAELASDPRVTIAFPVHPNPAVREPVERLLAALPHVYLLPPLGYLAFVDLMRRAWLLLTDSGGIQEEAPSLGKPVLVLRETTERPEAVQAGTVRLVGTDPARIVSEARQLLDSEEEYRRRAVLHNPYGDGHASERILQASREFLVNGGSDSNDLRR